MYWRILREQERPFKFVVSRLLMRSGISRFFLIRRAGFRLRFYPTHVSARLWLDPQYHGDFDEELFLRRYLRPGDTVIDAGANIGFTTLVATVSVGDHGKVIAVEPHPRIFSYLDGNVRLNRVSVERHNVAVGHRSGEIHLSDAEDECVNAVTDDARGLRAPLARLDELAAGAGPIALLKLDVEGYELFALRGGERVLDAVECIYFESFEDNFARYGYSCSDVFDLLHAAEFHVFRQLDASTLGQIEPHHTSKDCENLIAVRNVANLLERTGLQLTGSRSSS